MLTRWPSGQRAPFPPPTHPHFLVARTLAMAALSAVEKKDVFSLFGQSTVVASWREDELASWSADTAVDTSYDLPYSKYNPTPGTGRTGFTKVLNMTAAPDRQGIQQAKQLHTPPTPCPPSSACTPSAPDPPPCTWVWLYVRPQIHETKGNLPRVSLLIVQLTGLLCLLCLIRCRCRPTATLSTTTSRRCTRP